MKALYKKVLHFFFSIPERLQILKFFFAEWFAIFRKKPLYKDIKWTAEQQKEFDEYWKTNYGKKISNRWHRLYEASSGVHRVDYFPEFLYSTKLEPKLNNSSYCTVFSDKTLNDLLFDNRITNVRTPEYFFFNNHGIFNDADRNLISEAEAVELLKDLGDAVIKPTVDSSSGHNVAVISMHGGVNEKDGRTADEILGQYKSNFIVQEKIKPCKALADLYPTAINTLRVTSYVVDNRVEVAPISLRIGGGGKEVDNIHAGGVGVYVHNDGSLARFAYRLGYGDSFEKTEEHPDTHTVFSGYKLDFVPEIIAAAKRLHSLTADIRVISWDFTVDSDGCIVVIEANYSGQGIWFPQMISGESLFGKDTAEMLKYIKR